MGLLARIVSIDRLSFQVAFIGVFICDKTFLDQVCSVRCRNVVFFLFFKETYHDHNVESYRSQIVLAYDIAAV